MLAACSSSASPAVDRATGSDGGSTGDDAGVSPSSDGSVPPPNGDDDDTSTDGGGKSTDGGGKTNGDSGTSPPVDSGSGKGPNGNESWVWVYTDYSDSLTAIGANKASFTHVSPAFYSVNYAYASGVAYYATCPTSSNSNCSGNSSNSFDGLTTKTFTTKASGFGLVTVPLIYGGSGNGGEDNGIQAILDNTGGAQTAFISAMTTEAVSNGYGGYNLDWEVANSSPINGTYAAKFVSFVNAFKTALAGHGMSLTADAVVSNINGTYCSSNNGYLDFGLLSASQIDGVIIEDYVNAAGNATTTCQTAKLNSSSPIACDFTLTGEMNLMCPQNLPTAKAIIGFEADPGSTNPLAGTAFADLKSYGFTRVAVWPQAPFMSTSGISPAGSTWYALLKDFLTN